MTPPLRLAILLADTPQPKANATYGGYRGVFTRLLTSAAATLSPPRALEDVATITAYDVLADPDTYPALDDIDAILITGSRHTAFDDDPWILNLVEFTRRAVASGRVRTVGVCFGHQILGRALGATLGRSDKGWELAVTSVDLTDEGKQVFGLDKMRIYQLHKDIVADFPPGATPLGGNAICAVQAFYRPGCYIAVQGHPEYSPDIMTEVIGIRHDAGVFTDALFEDAMKRVPVEHDGVAIARAFIEFLQKE